MDKCPPMWNLVLCIFTKGTGVLFCIVSIFFSWRYWQSTLQVSEPITCTSLISSHRSGPTLSWYHERFCGGEREWASQLRIEDILHIANVYQILTASFCAENTSALCWREKRINKARELQLLCKLNQIDPMGIDLLGLSWHGWKFRHNNV